MTTDELVYQFCAQRPAFAALLSNRVYPMRKAQRDPFPALVYGVADTRRDLTMSGPGGPVYADVEFFCYGTSYSQARAVFQLLLTHLHGFRGTVFDVDVPSLSLNFTEQEYQLETGGFIQGAWLLDEEDLYSDEPKRFGVKAEYRIVFCE